jgi:uncharacterized protein (DUF983 family)
VRQASPLEVALAGRCPRCRSKTLFAGWVGFADRCRDCDLDLSSFNVGDGPAPFLIFLIGGLLVGGALSLDAAFSPSWWVHLIWGPVGLGLMILGLRCGKAIMLSQEYRHRAREGRIVE